MAFSVVANEWLQTVMRFGRVHRRRTSLIRPFTLSAGYEGGEPTESEQGSTRDPLTLNKVIDATLSVGQATIDTTALLAKESAQQAQRVAAETGEHRGLRLFRIQPLCVDCTSANPSSSNSEWERDLPTGIRGETRMSFVSGA